MIFVLWYDRDHGKLIELAEYSDERREAASRFRLELELDLLERKVYNEIVMLEAESLDALRETHNRYFRNVEELAAVKLRRDIESP